MANSRRAEKMGRDTECSAREGERKHACSALDHFVGLNCGINKKNERERKNDFD